MDHLAAVDGGQLISVLLPTHVRSREVDQDRIRLKNQLADADAVLAGLGWKPRQRSERLAQAHGLLDDLEFREHQDSGLAVYIDEEGDVVPVATTRPLKAATWVMPVFMLRPLAAELNGPKLPVLALTRQEASLFIATEFGVDEVPADLPSYEDVNWFVDREKERQQHPDAVGSDRNRHGHEPSLRRQEDLARFLREVDAAIEGYDEETLIVLGDGALVNRFADVSDRSTVSHPNTGLSGEVSSEDVAGLVDDIIADIGRQRIEEKRARARDSLATDLATVEIGEAIPAAIEGRIDQVLFDPNAPAIWGRFDEGSMQVEMNEDQRVGDVELLDRLVIWARRTGAEIISTEGMADETSFIATFRF